MNELKQNIFDKWKMASLTGSDQVSFEVNYTSTVVEFMKLLKTWGVPYKAVHDEFRVCIITMNYWDVMTNKGYYYDNGITEEIMENYYA